MLQSAWFIIRKDLRTEIFLILFHQDFLAIDDI